MRKPPQERKKRRFAPPSPPRRRVPVRRRSFWAGVAAGLGVSAVLVTSTFVGHSSGRTLWSANSSQLRDRLNALGLPALGVEGRKQHIHQHLDLYVNGDHVTVPGGIGIGPNASFYSPLHTHDSSGIVHVESPGVGTFTLGQFFGVWGVRLTRRCIGGYCSAQARTLQAFVDGKRFAWYRFARKLRGERAALAASLDALAASLRQHYPDMGREVAIDASDMPAYANGQRYIFKGGPERQAYSDPDASWGHRSAVSTRKGGGFYGYRIHAAVCAVTGLPLAWRVETARSHESMHVASLLDAVSARGFAPQTVAMDMGYDNNRVYAECAERRCAAIIPLRKNQGERDVCIPRNSDEWRSLYRRRSAVEREFGRLKHNYGLAILRVRGIERVRLHADLVILGRLALALSQARTASLAA